MPEQWRDPRCRPGFCILTSGHAGLHLTAEQQEIVRVRADLAAARAALSIAERESREHLTPTVMACRICDQTGPVGGEIDHAPDCPFGDVRASAVEQPATSQEGG